ncbi:MAG TPA: NrfD/PsrC family molybdoenzyme membrane anchor subunit, partial [Vicinamibacteria bacterium]|nr:NrfD/PsrC family molybdoenzyme membrane anchor subunit [Vicinamibacteria bacterium]
RPKLFYVEGDADALVPAAAPPPSDYMWASAPQAASLLLNEEAARSAPRRTYGVKEQHRNSWGWKVSAYLWTKSVAAGAFLVPALAALSERRALLPVHSAAALVFLALTAVLLVWDLRQPRRFLWTLTRPQWRSWLVRGAYILTAYGGLLTLALLSALNVVPWPLPAALVALTLLAAVASAVYTAFLFGQAKGRDLWQSALLGPHLLVQALAAGAALFAPGWLLWLLPANGLLVAGEVWGRHATEDARRAAHIIQDDPRFSSGVLAAGHLLPLALLWGGVAPGVVAALVLLGLYVWEHLYVQAPQQVPLA